MKQLLTKIYLYRIFSEFMLLYPLYSVMFAERGRLSTLQISVLLAIWSIIILVAEVPSGALADKYSRRLLLGIAQGIRSIGYTTWIFWPTFEGFLLGLGLWGVARSMASGTFEALVFDELKAVAAEKRYVKIIGRTESMALFFSLGSTLLAVPVFAWLGYDGVLWFSVAATIIAGFIVLSVPHKKKQESVEALPYLTILRRATKEVRLNHALLKLIVFGVFVGVLFRIFDEYASLIIKATEVSTVAIPLISTLVYIPLIVAGFFAYRLEKLRQVWFMGILIVAGMALALAGKWLGPLGLVGFAAFLLLVKVSITVFGAKVQHSITGHTRATITSINNFGVEVAAVVGFFVYGLLVQASGTSGALIIIGLATSVVGAAYLAVTRGRLLKASG